MATLTRDRGIATGVPAAAAVKDTTELVASKAA
jgi:hypothetical protein